MKLYIAKEDPIPIAAMDTTMPTRMMTRGAMTNFFLVLLSTFSLVDAAACCVYSCLHGDSKWAAVCSGPGLPWDSTPSGEVCSGLHRDSTLGARMATAAAVGILDAMPGVVCTGLPWDATRGAVSRSAGQLWPLQSIAIMISGDIKPLHFERILCMPKSAKFMACTHSHAHSNAAPMPMHSRTQLWKSFPYPLSELCPLWIHIPHHHHHHHHQPLNPTMANTGEVFQ